MPILECNDTESNLKNSKFTILTKSKTNPTIDTAKSTYPSTCKPIEEKTYIGIDPSDTSNNKWCI